MRLAEIAQAPSRGAHNAQQGGARNQAAVFLACRAGGGLHCCAHFIGTAHGQIHHNRREQQRKKHQRGLYGVGPAHRQKAADKGVGNGGTGAQPHGGGVVDVKQALKQARPGHNARSTINGEEKQNNRRRNHLNQFAVRTEAAGKILRQGERVIVVFGVDAQAPGHQQPVEISAHGKADGNPRLAQAAEVNRAGQAHQQPAGHIGSTGRHGGNKAAQASAAQNIVAKIFGRKIRCQANQQHRHQVNTKCDIHRVKVAHHHLSLE